MLINLRLSEVALICGGKLLGEDAEIQYVKTDSREHLANTLFLALEGESSDGHDYLDTAKQNGAVAVLSQHETSIRPVVKVRNTLDAYGQIAHHQRSKFAGKVVAITGSNGKTTVKDWLAQCLDSHFSVLKTSKNYNNQIGVPQTLLGLDQTHEIAIIEAGTSYVGEIPKLTKIIAPDIAIITNASGSHLSGLGSIEGVAKEKGALLAGLPSSGVAILNHDDRWFDYWCSLVEDKKVMSFGFSDAADMFASDIQLQKSGSRCIIHFSRDEQVLELTTPGKHQIANAMAVLICLVECGLSLQQGVAVLRSPLSISGRLEILRSNTQSLILNDCYNASPTSVEAAIDVLSYQDEECKWLVLGELSELGSMEYETHKSLGEYAFYAGIDRLICLGSIAATAAQAFQAMGGVAIVCANHSEVVEILQPLDINNAILVKGSRSSRMEKIIENLVN